MRQRRKEREWWESGWIRNKDKWRKGTRKLHLQFGHTSKEKIKRLIDEAYGEKESLEDVEGCKKEIEKMCDKCETCIKLRRNPKKQVVGFPIGRVFNEEIGVNVGELEGEKFLVMINLATHYCQRSWI